MRRLIAALALVALTGCVNHYTVNTTIDGKPYICKIRIDRNNPDHNDIQNCVPGQLP